MKGLPPEPYLFLVLKNKNRHVEKFFLIDDIKLQLGDVNLGFRPENKHLFRVKFTLIHLISFESNKKPEGLEINIEDFRTV